MPGTTFVKPIYRVIYLVYRPALGLWYWARRRFTLAGLCVAGGFLVAGAVGADMENTVTYQAFALLLALLVSAFASGRFLPRQIFRDAFSAALRHRRPAAALPRAGEKSDRANRKPV